VSLESERERIVEQLSAHYAEDHLSTQELEERFELAYRARSVAELAPAVAGLPALTQPVRAPAPRPSTPRVERRPDEGERRYAAVMSTFRKDGEWMPSRYTRVLAVMANARLDLRDATFVDQEIVFDVKAVMSEVQILVPPGVTVECDGSAFMGEFSGRHDDARIDPDAPRVVVRGSAIMSQVRVETRLPGESRLTARRRQRQLRKGGND
jgi:hypothetical protein